MAESSGIGGMLGLDPSLQSTGSTQKKKSGDELGQTEFLQLLVTQLKHQDPLNPMENQEFAVQLAQFSSLEQLVSINEKVGGSGSSNEGFSSLASYLGHEVVLNSDSIHVENNYGGRLAMTLNQDASDVKIELLRADGSVAETSNLGPIAKGKHAVDLAGLSTASGDFKVRVSAIGATGSFSPEVHAAGIVSGFVPGPEPKLLINGREVSTSDIREVRIAAQ